MSGSDPTWTFAMRWLARPTPGGAFVWQVGGLRAVARRLAWEVRGPRAVAAVGGLLRLTSALRRRLGSPAAADQLQAVLRSCPEACALARRAFGSDRRRQALRRFHSSLGEAAPPRAPPSEASEAPGAVRLSRLIDPTERDRRWAQARRS